MKSCALIALSFIYKGGGEAEAAHSSLLRIYRGGAAPPQKSTLELGETHMDLGAVIFLINRGGALSTPF